MTGFAFDDPQELLAHDAWVRGLARRLVADGHAADDLAQDAWLSLLRAPGAAVRAPRRFLAGILRKRRLGGLRAGGRRGEHEAAAARERAGAAAPGADEALERAELARAVVELVLALEEPFRSAVLLRYGEGLSAAETARRLGVGERTLESRARRGLALLRERWTRARRGDAGAWGLALARLAGAPPPPATFLAPAAPAASAAPALSLGSLGVFLMQTKLVLVALALAGGAGALWWWQGTAADAARPARVAATERAAQAPELVGAALAPAAGADIEGARAALAVEPSAGAPAETPAEPAAPERRLRGRVFDVEARPLAGVEVALGSYGGGPSGDSPRAVSGPDGVFELDASQGTHGEVRAVAPELATLVASNAALSGTAELVVVVARHRPLAGRVLDERGAPVPGARVALRPPQGFLARFDAILDHTRLHLEGVACDAEGRFALAHAPLLPGAQLEAQQDGFAPAAVPAPDGPASELELVLQRPALEESVLAGRVVDELGGPAAGAWVTLGARCALSGADGGFRLERTGAEEACELRALLRGHRPGYARVERDPATGAPRWPAYVEVRLEGPPLKLAGVVVDELGEPRPGVSLWIADPTPFGVLGEDMGGLVEFLLAYEAGAESDPGEVYWFATMTDEAGRFELPGLLARDYTLELLDDRRLERAVLGPFAAGDGDARVVFPHGPLQDLKGRVVSRAGAPLPGIDVVLLGATFGGVWRHSSSTRTDQEGRFTLEGVGNAQLMLSLSGEGIVPAWHGVELGQPLELVAVALMHAKVELADPGRATAFRVLDAGGGDLDLYSIEVGGVTRLRSAEIVDGRSRVLGVPEHAALLVLEQDGAEVDRVPLRLEPGRLNVLRP